MTSTHQLLTRLAAILCLLAGFHAPESAAQSWRAGETFYLKPKAGLNTYAGDWARSSNLFAGPPGPSTGLEVGYRRRAGFASTALGAYFLAGRYPSIARGAPAGMGPLVSELEQWRHTLGLVGQVGFAPERRLSPYVQLGAGATVGNLGKDFRAAFSPIGGLGLDVALTDQVGFFVEATGILGLPDRGLDATADVDDRPVDWFSFLGAGVRINIGPSFTPVDVRGIDGPTQIRPGEAVTFAARSNEEEATGAVSYQWDFGDGGAPGEGRTATHRFEEPGNYVLVLTGRNKGHADRQRLSVTVTEPAPVAASRDSAASTAEETRETTVRFPSGAREEGVSGEDTSRTASAPADSTTLEAMSAEQTPGAQADAQTQADAQAAGAQASASQAGAPAAVSCNDIADLNAAHFEAGSDALSAEGEATLEDNIAVLEACPGLSVRLEGYAAPNEPDAQALASARADAVRRFYRQGGVAERRIETGGPYVGQGSKGDDLSAMYRVDTVPAPASSTADASASGEN